MIESTLVSRPVSRAIALLSLLLLCTLGACSNQNSTPEQLIASARQERDKGHYRNAIVQLKNALQNSPQNAEARYLLGETFNDIDDFKSAEIELRKAMDLRYDLARVKLGKSLLMMGQFQKVLDEVPVDTNVDNAVQAEILTLRALASIGLRRIPEGRALLEQALARQPEFAEALVVQSQFATAEGKDDEAAKLIDRAIASAPKNVNAWLLKGDLARSKADQAGAAAAYQKIIEFSPENIRARVNITLLQIGANNLDDAQKQLAQIRKLAPQFYMVPFMEGLIEFRKANRTAARDAALRALKAAPDYLPGVLLAGAVEDALGAHVKAQAHLATVLAAAPRHLYTRKLLVASLMKSGQMQRAIEVLQPGLQQAPDDAEFMALAGEVYLQSNEFAKAVPYFEKAAKLDPKSTNARAGLGVSRMGTGETDRALADLESAVQLDSSNYYADFLLIMSHLQRRNYDGALQAMQSFEKKQPNNPLTYNLKAMIYSGKKDQAAARKNLEHALELSPTYVAAAINLARMDLQDGKPALARRRLEAILEKDKNNTPALIALANLAPRIGATSKEVIDWLERARKATPDMAQPQLMLARAYAKSGDPKKALEIARQAQAAHPDSWEALDTLGALQIGAGENAQALATYNQLVALQPKSATALFWLAMAQTANADPAGAANTLRKALALQPAFSEAQMALAGLEVNARRYPDAMKIAQQMQKQSAKSPAGFVLEGNILMAEKKFQQAVKVYETAYALDKSGRVVIKLYQAYTQAGKPDEAEKRLAQGLKNMPNDATIRHYAAEKSLKSGNYKNAIEQYEWLMKAQPDNVVVLNNLAMAYHKTKDARAVETAERAYKLAPRSAALADTLGWILVEQGNTKRGLELLQQAVTAEPANAEMRYHLAQAFIKAGDQAKAQQELEKLLANSPKSGYAAEAKQLLEKLR